MVLVLTLLHVGLWVTLAANLRYLRRRAVESPAPDAAPLVSVLVPARNEAQNLRRLVPSLLEQNYPAFEVIVYDDGSTDATPEVLDPFADERLHVLRGEGPPVGWVGKVHALYQATRAARGASYLFLDADACLTDADALGRLTGRFEALPIDAVLTGFTRLRGRAKLLVSLVPHVILTGLPWPLVRRLRMPALGALNGQCWMIDADTYHRHEPHRHHRAEVLEDVMIGRYLKACGHTPVMVDVQRDVCVYMYRSFAEAWRGFRKNTYLLLGGTPLRFLSLGGLFVLTFILAPLFASWLLLSVYGLKAATDWYAGFPLWVSLLAPLSLVLAVVLQWDSALHHLTGRVTWKGRHVGPSTTDDR